MAAFLLFVFVLAGQLIAGFNTQLPPPVYGNLVTILSIDGGGIRGIIPAVVLQHLEKALKVNDIYIYIIFSFRYQTLCVYTHIYIICIFLN